MDTGCCLYSLAFFPPRPLVPHLFHPRQKPHPGRNFHPRQKPTARSGMQIPAMGRQQLRRADTAKLNYIRKELGTGAEKIREKEERTLQE